MTGTQEQRTTRFATGPPPHHWTIEQRGTFPASYRMKCPPCGLDVQTYSPDLAEWILNEHDTCTTEQSLSGGGDDQ